MNVLKQVKDAPMSRAQVRAVALCLVIMAIGGLFLTPFADRIGRSRLGLRCLALASLGMLAASISQKFGQLLASRLITGAAVGAMAASLPVLTCEFAHPRGAPRLTSTLSTA
ncbi:MFS family permease [Streptomyces sp. SAI-117]|uniref:MFS transporter n=1 Tax=unclassified Streptomyces TaxID=2593676 RepID=UPI002476BB06|nr:MULTISPECIES: MFS transporter [unclassified Streptomyces]MDH6554343.1 MFS family permease [Streptomyces sp. SAI-041]MDH6573606.1 MFS family permease [Streptomyces sp. SAI-117]MDH6581658.1 MFS family permease [Streptomyces sp. SAI-133]